MTFSLTPRHAGLLLVGNAAPDALEVKGTQRIVWQVLIISHWGGKRRPVGQSVIKAFEAKYPDIRASAISRRRSASPRL